VNESNNIWRSSNGEIEKDIVLDGYIGKFSTKSAPLKIEITEKNRVLFAEITDFPKFSLISIGKDKFESEEAGVVIEFNEAKSGFEMTISENQKIPFTRD
jgi:hypothetical protein